MEDRKIIEAVIGWKELFNIDVDHKMSVQVSHFVGTARDIADRARTTIGLEPGTKDVKETYMRKMYLCEHSPIRVQQYLIKFTNIPYSIAMHFVRHKNGVEPFVSTSRDDRVDINKVPTRDRDKLPVNMELLCNSQAIINISRKRLCSAAHKNTIASWNLVKYIMEDINPSLAKAMVPDCIYRGWCYEHKSCGYHLTPSFKEELVNYRKDINHNVRKNNSK